MLIFGVKISFFRLMTDINIYIPSGNEWITWQVPVTEQAELTCEVMKEHCVNLQWNATTDTPIPAGAYIIYNGVRFTLIQPYYPEQQNTEHYVYKPKFEHEFCKLARVPFMLFNGTTTETDWNYCGLCRDIADLLETSINNALGYATGGYSVDFGDDNSDNDYRGVGIDLAFSNVDILTAINSIADQLKCEWYTTELTGETGKILHFKSRCITDATTLEWTAGTHTDRPNVQNNTTFYNRFYIFGSTRNIPQDYNGASVQTVVNKRLTLNPAWHEGGYIDLPKFDANGNILVSPTDTGYQFYDKESGELKYYYPDDSLATGNIFSKVMYLDDIYPRADLKVKYGSVSYVEQNVLDDNGEIVKDGNGYPTKYRIYFFQLVDSYGNLFTLNKSTYDPTTNPNGNIIKGLTLSAHFNTGALTGREHELCYYDTAAHKYGIDIAANTFEIIFKQDNTIIVPNENMTISGGTSASTNGDEVVIFNVRMPQQYVTKGYQDLEEAGLLQIWEETRDKNAYTVKSNPLYFADNISSLFVGNHVLFTIGTRTLDTRITKIVEKLDRPFEKTITFSKEVSKGTISTILTTIESTQQQTITLHEEDDMATKVAKRLLYQAQDELKSMVFNPDGSLSPNMQANVETMMLSVGATSTNFALSGITFIPNYVGSNNQPDPNTFYVQSNDGKLTHYGDIEQTIGGVEQNVPEWTFSSATISSSLTTGNAYYLYARCPKTGASGTFVLSTEQKRYDGETGYYNFLVGALSSVVTDGTKTYRIINLMYGSTTINGRFIKTGRIASINGDTYFDLDSGTICGNIRFEANKTASETINGLIDSNTNVENALKSANDGGLWPNRLFQLSTPTIGAATTETAPFGTARLLNSRDHQATESSAIPLIAGHTYHFVIEFYARRLSGSASLNCGVWTNNEGTMWYYGASTKVSDYDANWAFYRRSFAFTTPSGATTARLFFQIDQAYSGGDTQWLICDVQWYDADNDLAQTTASSALSSASSAQSAAQQAQQDASAATTAVNNMNGDNVFSVVEKKAFRPEWKSIQGLNDTTSTPTASTTNGGSYEKALIAANGITDSIITADVSALTTAYSTLKTFLNTYALYTSSNSNWGDTGQSTLGSNTKAYYDAETKLYNDLSDYYMRQVEVGGANLMRSMLRFRQIGNYYNIIGNGIYMLNQNSDSRVWNSANAQHVITLPKGTYTISVYTTEVETDSSVGFSICYASSWIFRAENLSTSGFGTVGRHSATFYNASTADVYVMVKAYHAYKLKVEAGNKATDFTAAPEDEATGNGTNLLIGTNGATVDITQTAGGSYQSKQPFTSSKVIGTATSEMWVTLQFKVDNWTNNFSPVNSVVIGKAFDYSDGWSRRISFAPSSVGSLGGSATGVENYDKYIQINSTTRLYYASVKVRKGDNINQSKPIFVCCQNNGTSSTAYSCSLYDVKMEVGSSPTEYTIAPEDVTQEMIDEANAVRREQSYLNAAYKSNTDIKGGLILSSLIQVRNPNSESDDDVKAGMNGVVEAGAEDVRFWAGGTLAKAAQTLASTNGTLTENNSVPFVVLHDGTVILSKAIIDAIGAANKLRFENGKIVFYNGTTKKTELVADTKASVDAMLEDMQSSKDSNKTLTFSARSATNFSQVSQTNATAASTNAPSYTLSQSASYNGNSGTAFTAVGDELATIASAATLAITINASDIQFVPNVSGQNASATIIKVVNRAMLYLNGNNNTSFVVGTATVETTALTAQTVNISLSSGAVVGNLTKGVTYTPQLIISRSVTAKFTTTNVSVAQGTINLTGSHQYSQLAPVLTFTAAGYVNKMYGNGLAMAGYSDLFFAFNSSVYERCLHIKSGVGELAYRKNFGLVHREKASGSWSLVSPIFMVLDVTTTNGGNGSVTELVNNRNYSFGQTAKYVSSSYSNTKGIWRITLHNTYIEQYMCLPTAFGSAFYCSVLSQGYNSTDKTYVDIRCTVDHDNYSQHPSGVPFRFRMVLIDIDSWTSNLPS